jgi:hypothetical protein
MNEHPTIETPRADGADPVSNFVVPSRMGYRWKHFNHRISVWKFGLACNGGREPWADHVTAHSIGGPFSTHLLDRERPVLKFGFQRVDLDSTQHVGATRRRFDVSLDASGCHRGEYMFDREALGLEGYETIVPIVTGFGFDTDVDQPALYPSSYNPAHGYLTRGLGVDVRRVDIDARSVTIAVELRYGFGTAMDRPHHNEALLYARLAAELDIAFIGLDGVPWETGGVEYRLDGDEPKIGVDEPVPPADTDETRVQLQGRPRAPMGCVGIQGFDFDLTPTRSCRWSTDWPLGDHLRGDGGSHPVYGSPGYYVRELTLDVESKHYDPSTGRAEFAFEGFASNATRSIAFHPLEARFRGRMAWFQIEGARPAVRFDSDFPTGRSEFALDEMG